MALLEIISVFRVSRAVYVAAKLGIADLLKDSPKSADELALSTGTHAPSLYRLLCALASFGVFAQNDQGWFSITPISNALRSDVPDSLRAFAIVSLGEERYQAWGDLLHSVATGEIAFDHVFGTGVWKYQALHPEQAKIFDEAMANIIAANNAAVLASYPFSTIDILVDVGGGNGSFMITLLRANPAMKGVLFDLPHVAQQAETRIADAGLAERCKIIGGDMFVAIPEGGTAYVLSQIQNSFDDDRAIVVLKNCRDAMTRPAKLLLVERVLPDRAEPSPTAQAAFATDLHMLVTTGGRQRTESQYRALLEAGGFRLTKTIRTRSEMSVIEGEPA
jgi:hypothetical protein